MRFGIYAEMQCPDSKSHEVLYDEIIRQMVHADQVGFDATRIPKQRGHATQQFIVR